MNAVQKKRLLNVARALEESKNPDKFDMSVYGHSCGTPACAFGHYAARRDLQKTFRLSDAGYGFEVLANDYDGAFFAVYDHFGLKQSNAESYSERHDGDEALELFGHDGCGNARTAREAARYIRKFVARKEKEAAK